MTLVDGEEIFIEMEHGTCRPHNVLVRLSSNIVVGLYHDKEAAHRSAVFLWHNVDGVYRYLGDISLSDRGDGSVHWHVVPSSGMPDTDLNRKIREMHRKQILEMAETINLAQRLGQIDSLHDNTFKFLSAPHV